MNTAEYTDGVLRTKSNGECIHKNLKSQEMIDLLHAAVGVTTEGGELLDGLKKNLFYDKKLDTVNILEEFGDLLWYIALGINACGGTIEGVMERNIAKLRARYGEKFSNEAANNRDLSKERKVLES